MKTQTIINISSAVAELLNSNSQLRLDINGLTEDEVRRFAEKYEARLHHPSEDLPFYFCYVSKGKCDICLSSKV